MYTGAHVYCLAQEALELSVEGGLHLECKWLAGKGGGDQTPVTSSCAPQLSPGEEVV